VASLVTQAELDGEVTDSHVGEQSRMMSQFLRIANTYLTQGAQCNLVFTNQMRDKIGGFGGKTTPGGRALKFYASNRIEMYKAATLAENEVKYGQKVHATVIKNKSSAPFRFGEFDLVWGQGIDYIAELFDLCVARGLIVGAGAWFSIGGKSFGQGRRNCCDNLRGNPALCYQLYDAMMTGALAERGLTPEGELIPNFQDPTPPMGTVATAFAPVPGAPAELKQAA